MTPAEKVEVLRKAIEEIRLLTFDECWESHYFDVEKCLKNEPRDWAKIQAIAAKAMRKVEAP